MRERPDMKRWGQESEMRTTTEKTKLQLGSLRPKKNKTQQNKTKAMTKTPQPQKRIEYVPSKPVCTKKR
jgi:hypothetical protein